MPGSDLLSEYLWVGGGAVLTIALGAGLLYWIDQEWCTVDRKRPRGPDSPPRPADDERARPPADDPGGPAQ